MTFIEDDGFQRRCKGLLDDEALGALMDWLAARPDAGKVIPGAGGLRKLGWAAKGARQTRRRAGDLFLVAGG